MTSLLFSLQSKWEGFHLSNIPYNMTRNKFPEWFSQATLCKINCFSLEDPWFPLTKEAQWQLWEHISLSNVERHNKSTEKGDIKCFLSLNHDATGRRSDMEVVALKQCQNTLWVLLCLVSFLKVLRKKIQWCFSLFHKTSLWKEFKHFTYQCWKTGTLKEVQFEHIRF